MCCSLNWKAVRVATLYYTRAWATIKPQEKNVILLLYTFSKTNTFEKFIVLQPEPQSGEGGNTLLHKSLGNC